MVRATPTARLRIVRDIAEGLDVAARHGVFHRALSPAAVLLDGDRLVLAPHELRARPTHLLPHTGP